MELKVLFICTSIYSKLVAKKIKVVFTKFFIKNRVQQIQSSNFEQLVVDHLDGCFKPSRWLAAFDSI